MAKKKKKKVARGPKRKVGRPRKTETKAKAKGKAKGKKAKAKKPRAVKAVAVRKPRNSARYLIIDTLSGLHIKPVAVLTPEIRTQARLGVIAVIDCQRVLVMTPKGAWSVFSDGLNFASVEAPAEFFANESVSAAPESAVNADVTLNRVVHVCGVEVSAPTEAAEEFDDQPVVRAWESHIEVREPIAASPAE